MKMNEDKLKIPSAIRYYIASRILMEIIEACDYLNRQKFPIAESCLKTSKIFIAKEESGKMIKIGSLESSMLLILRQKEGNNEVVRKMIGVSMMKNIIMKLFSIRLDR